MITEVEDHILTCQAVSHSLKGVSVSLPSLHRPTNEYVAIALQPSSITIALGTTLLQFIL